MTDLLRTVVSLIVIVRRGFIHCLKVPHAYRVDLLSAAHGRELRKRYVSRCSGHEDAAQAVTVAFAAVSMSFTTSFGWETIAT